MWTFANSRVEFREPNFVLIFLHRMHREFRLRGLAKVHVDVAFTTS